MLLSSSSPAVHAVLDGGERRPAVRADRLAVERADHRLHLGRLPGVGHDLLDDAGVPRVGDGGAVGRDEHDLRARPGRAGRERGELVERVLGLRSGDGEPVVEGAAERDEQGDDGAEDRQPGDRDQPAVPEGGAAEPREEGAHGRRVSGDQSVVAERSRRSSAVRSRSEAARSPAEPRAAPPPSTSRMTTPSCRARTMRARRFAGRVRLMPMRAAALVDERGQPAVQLLGVPAQGGGRLGVPRGVQAVLGVHQDPGPVGAEGGQAALDGRGDRVVLVLQPGQLLLGVGEVTGGLPLEEGGEQLVLGAEAGVEGAAGESAAATDVLDARRGEADLGERLQRGVQQPLDGLRATALGPRLELLDSHDAGLYWIHPCIRCNCASDLARPPPHHHPFGTNADPAPADRPFRCRGRRRRPRGPPPAPAPGARGRGRTRRRSCRRPRCPTAGRRTRRSPWSPSARRSRRRCPGARVSLAVIGSPASSVAVDGLGGELAERRLLLPARRGVDARVGRLAEVVGQLAVCSFDGDRPVTAWISRGQQRQQDAVLVRRPHAAVPAQERGAGGLLAAEADRPVEQARARTT